MQFRTSTLEEPDHCVYAVDPKQGNDAALLAVFNNPRSAERLAAFLNWAYSQFTHASP